MLLLGQSVLTLEAFSTKAYLNIFVHTPYKQSERILFFFLWAITYE